MGVCVLDESFIFAIGGYGSSGRLDTIERYRWQTDQWEVLTLKLQTATFCLSVIAVNSQDILILGGRMDGSGKTNKVFKFNVNNMNQMTELSAMKKQRVEPSAYYNDGKVYMFGGDDVPDTEVYDVATNTWSDLEKMPETWRNIRGAATGFK